MPVALEAVVEQLSRARMHYTYGCCCRRRHRKTSSRQIQRHRQPPLYCSRLAVACQVTRPCCHCQIGVTGNSPHSRGLQSVSSGCSCSKLQTRGRRGHRRHARLRQAPAAPGASLRRVSAKSSGGSRQVTRKAHCQPLQWTWVMIAYSPQQPCKGSSMQQQPVPVSSERTLARR
jgi:hypothetical protein